MKIDNYIKEAISLMVISSLILMLLLSGCSRRLIRNVSKQIDSVQVREKTEYIERLRMDAVYVPIPAQSAARETQDSTSHLETDFATSDARIMPSGALYHDLHNKPQRYAVTVPVIDTKLSIVRDSIVYRDREVIEVREVKHIPRFFWWCFGIAATAVLWGAWKLYRRI